LFIIKKLIMLKNIFLLFFCNILFGQIQIGNDIDGEAADDHSGGSVSLSSDGTTVAIGAANNDGDGLGSGHVRIYRKTMGAWAQIGSDIDGEAADDQFGRSISLSSDGNIVAIGGSNNDGNGSNSGHVRVYQYLSGNWAQIGGDIDGEAANDNSGSAVSLSNNGNIVAIGALNNDGNGINSGHVRIYQYVSGNWTQIGNDVDGEAANDRSGAAISLSSNGNIVAIKAPNNDGNGLDSGHVRVYQYIFGNWTQIGSDIDGEAANDNLINSIDLSENGDIIAIGANNNDGNGLNSGHVRVYQNFSGNWVQIGSDIDGEAAGDNSGGSVCLSSDGAVIAVGAVFNDGNGLDSGHVRVYKYISGNWTQIGIDIDGEASMDLSGYSISLSNNGSVIAIGASYNNGNFLDSGHVRVYNLSSLLSLNTVILNDFIMFPNPSSDAIQIILQENQLLEKVNIYNLLGQIVKSEKKKNVKIDTLTNGSYIIEVITNEGKATKKLIKY
jgi:hypothetical protein